MKRCLLALIAWLALGLAVPAMAQTSPPASATAAQSSTGSLDLSQYEKRVTVKKLANGLTVLIWRRPEAPVFSFFTMVDAGSAQDPLHETGLSRKPTPPTRRSA